MKRWSLLFLLSVFGLFLFFSDGVEARSTKESHSQSQQSRKIHAKRKKHKQDPLKKKTVKKSVALQPFQTSFPYSSNESRYLLVTDNMSVIYEYIRKFNPSVSSNNAFLIAQELAYQGKELKIDPKFVAAIMAVESRFNHRIAHNGAMGLGQLMGSTARSLGVRDPFSITQNVRGTSIYIKQNLDLFSTVETQGQLALACYLLGPRGVREGRGFPIRVHRYVGLVNVHYNALLGLP